MTILQVKGAAIGHVRAVPCEKGDYYFCRGCMTRFIWMDVVSFSTEGKKQK